MLKQHGCGAPEPVFTTASIQQEVSETPAPEISIFHFVFIFCNHSAIHVYTSTNKYVYICILPLIFSIDSSPLNRLTKIAPLGIDRGASLRLAHKARYRCESYGCRRFQAFVRVPRYLESSNGGAAARKFGCQPWPQKGDRRSRAPQTRSVPILRACSRQDSALRQSL